mgnify:FL=1
MPYTIRHSYEYGCDCIFDENEFTVAKIEILETGMPWSSTNKREIESALNLFHTQEDIDALNDDIEGWEKEVDMLNQTADSLIEEKEDVEKYRDELYSSLEEIYHSLKDSPSELSRIFELIESQITIKEKC